MSIIRCYIPCLNAEKIMRTTLALDDELVAQAQAYTGIKEKSALVREALRRWSSGRRRSGSSLSAAAIPTHHPPAAALPLGEIAADSSIWIDHIRQPNEPLAGALRARAVLLHPLVIGEIAMGSIASRSPSWPA